MKTLTVDRIEENIAVCMDENEILTEISMEDLPFEVCEGSIITVNNDGIIQLDISNENKRREELFNLQESLFDE